MHLYNINYSNVYSRATEIIIICIKVINTVSLHITSIWLTTMGQWHKYTLNDYLYHRQWQLAPLLKRTHCVTPDETVIRWETSYDIPPTYTLHYRWGIWKLTGSMHKPCPQMHPSSPTAPLLVEPRITAFAVQSLEAKPHIQADRQPWLFVSWQISFQLTIWVRRLFSARRFQKTFRNR